MSIRARFWVLAALRWLPVGLIVPVVALLPLERGLTIAELGAAFAVQGIVVLCLELPTGALCDVWGRKPVLLASAAIAIAAHLAFATAHTPPAFMAAAALAGINRALDSGPLNAWFVDSVHDDPTVADRIGTVARGLSGYAAVVGASIAAGAITTGALVAWAPFGRADSLAAPYLIAVGVGGVYLAAVAILMHEGRTRADGFRGIFRRTPGVLSDGVRLLSGSRVLRALVAVELFWGFGMIAFETMMPIRLAELLADRDRAASVMGPVSAAAWAVSAVGSAMVPLLLRRWTLIEVSVALRLLQGAAVVGMGLAWGPIGLVVGLLATYALHSASGAVYETLLHEQVGNSHRATVLSLASMAMHPGGSIGGVVLGVIATNASTRVSIVVGGVVLTLAAPLFLVRERPGPNAHRT